MKPESSSVLFVAIGLVAGVLAGVFGIGGGVVIVPALIYLAGFSQHRATGTSLAVLLPPIGMAAMWEYYRHGNVNVPAAMIIAAAVFVEAGSARSWRTVSPDRTCGLRSEYSWLSLGYPSWLEPSDASGGSDDV